MLDHAVAYAEAGYPTFPVHYPIHGPDGRVRCSCSAGALCRQIGKHPACANGVRDATVDRDRLRMLFRGRECNLGLATGAGSFDVLDDDPRHGGDATLAELQALHGPLPDTARSRTGGGGVHYLFDHLDGVRNNNTGKVGVGLDFKTTGGYVVAPPSLHASGARYEWENPGAQIARPPAWLADILRREFSAPETFERKSPEYWLDLCGTMRDGRRHNAIASVAGLLLGRASRVDPRLAIRLIHGYNRECCDPPKSRSEVDKIILHFLKR